MTIAQICTEVINENPEMVAEYAERPELVAWFMVEAIKKDESKLPKSYITEFQKQL